MLRKIRITLAAIVFVLLTALFLDYTGTLHRWFGWLAKIQFLPALLSLNVGVVVALVLLTLVFGRVLLLGHLSARYLSGHHLVVQRAAQEKEIPFLLFPRQVVAALHRTGAFHRGDDSGRGLFRGIAGAVQRLRAYGAEPPDAALRLDEQRHRLSCRACGQLCRI